MTALTYPSDIGAYPTSPGGGGGGGGGISQADADARYTLQSSWVTLNNWVGMRTNVLGTDNVGEIDPTVTSYTMAGVHNLGSYIANPNADLVINLATDPTVLKGDLTTPVEPVGQVITFLRTNGNTKSITFASGDTIDGYDGSSMHDWIQFVRRVGYWAVLVGDPLSPGIGGSFFAHVQVTGNVDISSIAGVLDNLGQPLLAVFLKDQSTTAENGFYVYRSGSPSTFAKTPRQPRRGDHIAIGGQYDGSFTPGPTRLLLVVEAIDASNVYTTWSPS